MNYIQIWPMLGGALEALNHLATIGLLVVAMYGLKQLSISKEASQISSRRDSVKAANEQIKYYLETVIPASNKLATAIEAKKIVSFRESSFILKESTVDAVIKPNVETFSKDIISLVEEISTLFNYLEAFSTFFTSELADENVAFKSVGKSFCSAVERYMPVIATLGGTYYYQNIIELYRLWAARLEEVDLKLKKADIDEKLRGKKSKVILPIGTKLS